MTKLYDLQNHILIHTGCMDPAEHRHMAAHTIISTGDYMKTVVDNKEYKQVC